MSTTIFNHFLLLIETFERIQTNLTFDDDDVWFGEAMQDVDWPELFKEVAPYLSYTDRITLLEVAGSDGVSPALLLAAGIYYKKENKGTFRHYIENLSVRLTEAFYIGDKNKE